MAENTPPLSIEKKDEYLLITFPPYRSVPQAESYIEAMFDAVDEHNCRKLLIDLRATRRQVPVMELYELCIYLVGKFGPVHAKIAVVASPEAAYPDRFGENVVRNRGLNLIRFVGNTQEALNWLLTTKPAISPPSRMVP
ncbi:MAG: hypothetical protein Q7T18_04035 [Sedimentisphaerales bacterium]|nr:hypothetical protein [Sedimentisphaerales bacterium]